MREQLLTYGWDSNNRIRKSTRDTREGELGEDDVFLMVLISAVGEWMDVWYDHRRRY